MCDASFRYIAATKLSTICSLYCQQQAEAAASSIQAPLAGVFNRHQARCCRSGCNCVHSHSPLLIVFTRIRLCSRRSILFTLSHAVPPPPRTLQKRRALYTTYSPAKYSPAMLHVFSLIAASICFALSLTCSCGCSVTLTEPATGTMGSLKSVLSALKSDESGGNSAQTLIHALGGLSGARCCSARAAALAPSRCSSQAKVRMTLLQ